MSLRFALRAVRNLAVASVAVPVIVATFGCSATAALQQASSGQVGCSPNEIVVEDDSGPGMFGGSRSWTATCGGTRHYCSAAGTTISCKAADKN